MSSSDRNENSLHTITSAFVSPLFPSPVNLILSSVGLERSELSADSALSDFSEIAVASMKAS